jgi:capsid protein
MIQRFLTPVWGYVIGCAIKDGFLRSTEYWTNVTWTTPRRVTVDAGRDAQQNRMDIESGLKSLTDNYLEEGLDPKEKMRENAAEKRYLLDLSKEFDVPLSMLYKPQNVAPSDINAAVADDEVKMDDGAKIVEDDVDPDDEETFNK